MAGGLHSTVNRRVAQFILAQDAPVRTVVVGRKGRDFMVRTGQDIQAVFTDLSDRPVLTDTSPVSGMVIDSYENGEVDEVYLVYAKFVSTMSQQAVVEKLLPVDPAPLSGTQRSGYIYEPDTLTVSGGLAASVRGYEVYPRILEALASEQSARMVAMRSATDNANSLARRLDPGYEQAPSGQHHQRTSGLGRRSNRPARLTRPGPQRVTGKSPR